MREGPDIARIGALIGDPARANILAALTAGKALTATELAGEAGVTASTASAHLQKLADGGLIAGEKQGRHRYFRLANAEVAGLIEQLTGLAAGAGHLRTRTGPRDDAMRACRVCYDHLAGEKAVRLFGAMSDAGFFTGSADTPRLSEPGAAFLDRLGIDVTGLRQRRRVLHRACLDWSERRHHLAGSLGAAMLEMIFARGWARRQSASRVVRFTPHGEAAFKDLMTDIKNVHA